MSRKEQHPGGVKLTAKTARTLAMQEFGTTRGLTKSTSFVGAYFMEFGNLRIEICADAACMAEQSGRRREVVQRPAWRRRGPDECERMEQL